MVQPNPPGDIPLIEGLGSEWNELVNYIPEDKRSEFAPKFKERIGSIEQQYEPLKQWEDLQKSGITPEHAGTALSLFSIIENNPREVYETLGKHLGITTQQAKEVVEAVEDGDQDDPRIIKMQQQIDTLAQIELAKHRQNTEEQRIQEQDAALEAEIKGIQKKYGTDIPEDEIIMRMIHFNMNAEQAYQAYAERVSEIQRRRPSPMIMGSGGAVPHQSIDPKKLNNAETKNYVAQLLRHANQERNRL